jgi:hypothetical protein
MWQRTLSRQQPLASNYPTQVIKNSPFFFAGGCIERV